MIDLQKVPLQIFFSAPAESVSAICLHVEVNNPSITFQADVH
jgi:hypothetical protein